MDEHECLRRLSTGVTVSVRSAWAGQIADTLLWRACYEAVRSGNCAPLACWHTALNTAAATDIITGYFGSQHVSAARTLLACAHLACTAHVVQGQQPSPGDALVAVLHSAAAALGASCNCDVDHGALGMALTVQGLFGTAGPTGSILSPAQAVDLVFTFLAGRGSHTASLGQLSWAWDVTRALLDKPRHIVRSCEIPVAGTKDADGFLATLVLEVLEPGCGEVFHAPQDAFHTRPDEAFAAAMWDAWRGACQRAMARGVTVHTRDGRWRLLQMHTPILEANDRSASGAAARGWWFALRNKVPDKGVLVLAQVDPADPTRLKGVNKVYEKTQAIAADQRKHVDTIVIATAANREEAEDALGQVKPWGPIRVVPLSVPTLSALTLCSSQEMRQGDFYIRELRRQAEQVRWGAPPNNLPLPASGDPFLGRVMELRQISDWLEEARFCLIALTGMGGIGKSRLARAAALWNSWRFHGLLYYQAQQTLEGSRASMLDALCRVVDCVLKPAEPLASLPTPDDRCQRAVEVLSAHRYLLVLDNLEVLPDTQTTELRDFLQLLGARSHTAVLLTRRSEPAPSLVGWLRAAPFPLHDGLYSLAVQSLDPADTVALLGRVLKPPPERTPTAQAKDVWNKVPSRPVPLSAEARLKVLAEQADVPLDKVAALEELAAVVHHHPFLLYYATATLEKPEYEWDGVLRRFRGLRSKDLQEVVEELIGTMCTELARRKPKAQRLLQALLVFAGGATLEALQCVWYGRPVDRARQDALAEVCEVARHAGLLDCTSPPAIDNAALQMSHSEFQPLLQHLQAFRYALHPLVRQYLTRAQSPKLWPQRRWARAHAAYYLKVAARAEEQYRRGGDATTYGLQLFDLEWENIQTGQMWAAAHVEHDKRAAEFCKDYPDAAMYCLSLRCPPSERIRWLEAALTPARRWKQHYLVGAYLGNLGNAYADLGRAVRARECYTRALAVVRQHGDRLSEGRLLGNLGNTWLATGDLEGALRDYEQALTVIRTSGGASRSKVDQSNAARSESRVLTGLGHVWEEQGHFQQAITYYQDALALLRTLDDTPAQCRVLGALGRAYTKAGDQHGATECYQAGLALARRLGDQPAIEYLEGALASA